MRPTPIGILHPGAMGATVGRALKQAGNPVFWMSAGRSAATRARAEKEAFVDVSDIETLIAEVSTIVSICPPHGSESVVEQVAATAFNGDFIDANAITPSRSAGQRHRITGAGGRYVDGSIVGPPADREGTTRLYLSGAGSQEIAALFDGGLLDVIALDGNDFAASALKMTYAAYTKGSAALLLAVSAAAHELGVDEALRREWLLSMPDLSERADRLLQYAGRKAWRFEEEMRYIAETMAGAGLPDGFHLAAAEVYRRLSGQVTSTFPVDTDQTLSDLSAKDAHPTASR